MRSAHSLPVCFAYLVDEVYTLCFFSPRRSNKRQLRSQLATDPASLPTSYLELVAPVTVERNVLIGQFFFFQLTTDADL